MNTLQGTVFNTHIENNCCQCLLLNCTRGISPQLVEKVCFFRNVAYSQALTPNPFPSGRGYFAGATAPRPCRGLRPCDPIFINDRGFSTVWGHQPFVCFEALLHRMSLLYRIGFGFSRKKSCELYLFTALTDYRNLNELLLRCKALPPSVSGLSVRIHPPKLPF